MFKDFLTKYYIYIIFVIIIIILFSLLIFETKKNDNAIIYGFLSNLNRNPENEINWETILLKKESFSPSIIINNKYKKKQSFTEKLTSIIDSSQTQEYIFWNQMISEGKISYDNFIKTLKNSDERKEKIKQKINEIYYNNVYVVPTSEELEKLYNVLNNNLNFTETNDSINSFILKNIQNQDRFNFLLTLSQDFYQKTNEQVSPIIMSDILALNPNETNYKVIINSYDPVFKKIVSDKYKSIFGSEPTQEKINEIKSKILSEIDFTETNIQNLIETTSEFKTILIEEIFNKKIKRMPTIEELEKFLSSEKTLSEFKNDVDIYLKSSTEYSNLDSIVSDEIYKNYFNKIYVVIDKPQLEIIKLKILNNDLLRDNLPEYIKSLPDYSSHIENLKKLIIGTYQENIGRTPTNTDLSYWISQIDVKQNLNASDFINYKVDELFYKAAALDTLSGKIILFTNTRVDMYSYSEKAIKESYSYTKFISGESGINSKYEIGKLLTVACDSPKTIGALWLMKTNNEILTIKDKQLLGESNYLTSSYLSELSKEPFNIHIYDICGMVSHPSNLSEIIIFLKTGEFMVWNINEKKSRFRLPIKESKVSFSNFPIADKDIASVSRVSLTNGILMFIKKSTNEVLFWDYTNGVEV